MIAPCFLAEFTDGYEDAMVTLIAVQLRRGQFLEASERLELEASRLESLIQQWVEETFWV